MEDTPVSGHLSKYQNPNSFSVNQVMTSTPARRIKTKPDDLNLQGNKVNMIASDVIPVTPAEQIFPVTPLTNVPVALSASHWVALADGSGVLNTRQVINLNIVLNITFKQGFHLKPGCRDLELAI